MTTKNAFRRARSAFLFFSLVLAVLFVHWPVEAQAVTTASIDLKPITSPIGGKFILDAEVNPEGDFVRFMVTGAGNFQHDVLSPSSTIPPIVYHDSWQTDLYPDGIYDIKVELWGYEPGVPNAPLTVLATDAEYGVMVSNAVTLTPKIPPTGLTTETVKLTCSTDKQVSSGVIFKVSQNNQGVIGATITTPTGSAPSYDYTFEVKPGNLPAGSYFVQCQISTGGQYVTASGDLEITSPAPTITLLQPLPGTTFSDYLKMEAQSDQESTLYDFAIDIYDSSGLWLDSTKITATAVKKYVSGQYVWVWSATWTPTSKVPSPAKIKVTPNTAAGSGKTIDVTYQAATATEAVVEKPTGDVSGKAVFTVRSSQEKVEVDVNVLDSANTLVAGPLGAGYAGKTTDSSGKTWYLFTNSYDTWDSTAVPDGNYKVLAAVYPLSGTPFKTDSVDIVVKNTTTTPIAVTWLGPTPVSTGLSGTQNLLVKTSPAASSVQFTIIDSTSVSYGPYVGVLNDPSTPDTFVYQWKTDTWPDGDYKILAQAFDGGVASGSPATRTLLIKNETTTPPVTITVKDPVPYSSLGSSLYAYASLDQIVQGSSCRFYLQTVATSSTASKLVAKTEVASTLGKNCTVSGWDISNAPDGDYELLVEAYSPNQTTPLATAKVVGLSKESVTPKTGLTVSLTQPTTGKYSGTITVKASVNKVADKVYASIKPLSTTLIQTAKELTLSNPVATKDSSGNVYYVWSAAWDTVKDSTTNGDYEVFVVASDSTETVKSGNKATVTVANVSETAKTEISITQPTSTQVASPLSGTVAFAAKASPTPSSVIFELVAADQAASQKATATFSSTTGLWSAKWDSAKQADGSWKATAVALTDGKESGRSSALSFSTKNTTPLSVTVTSPEGEVKGLTGMGATTGKKADKVLFRFYSSDATLALPSDIEATASDSSYTTWSATWDTQTTANGIYLVRALAYSGSEQATSDSKKVTVNNQTTTEQPTAVTVTLTAPADGSTQTGSFTVSAKTDLKVGRMTFQLTDVSTGQAKVRDGVSDSSGVVWKATVNDSSSPLADGQYRVRAVAVTAGVKVGESSTVSLTVKTAAATEETSETEEETTTAVQAPTVTMGTLAATLSGNQTLTAKASQNVTAVRFSTKNLATGGTQTIAAAKSSSGAWQALWQTKSVRDGRYEVRVNARTADGQAANAGPVTVTVKNVTETTASTSTSTTTTSTATSTTGTATGTTTATKETAVPLSGVQIIPTAVVQQAVLTKPEGTAEVTLAPISITEPSSTTETGAGQTETALDPECAKYSIAVAKCEDWLSWRSREDNECRQAGILTKQECAGYLQSKYGTVSEEETNQKTAGLLSVEKYSRLEQGLVPLIGSTFRVRPAAATTAGGTTGTATTTGAPTSAQPDLSETYQKLAQQDITTELGQKEAEDTLSEYLPIKPQKEVSLLVHASPAYVTNKEGLIQKQVPALVMVDDDQDGLPNDTEKRLGTDPNKADSDGDGFDDKTELENGYDPLRPGRRLDESDQQIAPVDAAIITGSPMEQPKAAGLESDDLKVDAAETIGDQAAGTGAAPVLRLRGRAQPGQTVTIYVYSYLPLVLTTTANSDGTWSYDLNDGVVDGEHEAYVAVNDDTGKIQAKSAPLAFLVAEAQAATEEQYFSPTIVTAEAPAKRLMSWYLVGAGLLILGAIVIGILIFSRAMKRNQPEF